MKLSEKIKNNTEIIAIIGLGYVGIPLVCEFTLNGLSVIGFDIDNKKIDLLNNAKSYIKHIKDADIKKCLDIRNHVFYF